MSSNVPHVARNTIAVARISASVFMWERIIGGIQECFFIF